MFRTPPLLPSLPSWERGLKSVGYGTGEDSLSVAPFVGAWIEIERNQEREHIISVAPFVGAWIEIKVMYTLPLWTKSLPSWERGLK